LAEAAGLHVVGFRRTVQDYFAAMGIPIRRGRAFTDLDGEQGPEVVIINETLAARLFPGDDPIGRRVAIGADPAGPWLSIVGVVADVRHGSLEEAAPAELYANYVASPPFAPFVTIRTAGDPAVLAVSVRQAVRAIDPGVTLSDVRTMDDVRRASLAERRFTLVLVAIFGGLALLLAVLGVYGVVALVLAERAAEVGLRVALGAGPAQVAWLVVADAFAVTATGLTAGLVVAAGVSQVAGAGLYGVRPLDPVTFVAVPLVLLAAATMAATRPALAAIRLDPVRALHGD
jgi:uncharacterized membrane protein YqjE